MKCISYFKCYFSWEFLKDWVWKNLLFNRCLTFSPQYFSRLWLMHEIFWPPPSEHNLCYQMFVFLLSIFKGFQEDLAITAAWWFFSTIKNFDNHSIHRLIKLRHRNLSLIKELQKRFSLLPPAMALMVGPGVITPGILIGRDSWLLPRDCESWRNAV